MSKEQIIDEIEKGTTDLDSGTQYSIQCPRRSGGLVCNSTLRILSGWSEVRILCQPKEVVSACVKTQKQEMMEPSLDLFIHKKKKINKNSIQSM